MSANLAFAIFILSVALVMAVISWRMLQADKKSRLLAIASAGWPMATGRIDAVELHVIPATGDDDAPTYEPRTSYSYAVASVDSAGTTSALSATTSAQTPGVIPTFTGVPSSWNSVEP